MRQADVALRHTAAIVYSFKDADPSVLFGVLARVEALLGSHIAVVSPAETAHPQASLKNVFLGHRARASTELLKIMHPVNCVLPRGVFP